MIVHRCGIQQGAELFW